MPSHYGKQKKSSGKKQPSPILKTTYVSKKTGRKQQMKSLGLRQRSRLAGKAIKRSSSVLGIGPTSKRIKRHAKKINQIKAAKILGKKSSSVRKPTTKRKSGRKKGFPKGEISIFHIKRGESLKEAHKHRGERGVTFFSAKNKKDFKKKAAKILGKKSPRRRKSSSVRKPTTKRKSSGKK
jgi:hypothetical protein